MCNFCYIFLSGEEPAAIQSSGSDRLVSAMSQSHRSKTDGHACHFYFFCTKRYLTLSFLIFIVALSHQVHLLILLSPLMSNSSKNVSTQSRAREKMLHLSSKNVKQTAAASTFLSKAFFGFTTTGRRMMS